MLADGEERHHGLKCCGRISDQTLDVRDLGQDEGGALNGLSTLISATGTCGLLLVAALSAVPIRKWE